MVAPIQVKQTERGGKMRRDRDAAALSEMKRVTNGLRLSAFKSVGVMNGNAPTKRAELSAGGVAPVTTAPRSPIRTFGQFGAVLNPEARQHSLRSALATVPLQH